MEALTMPSDRSVVETTTSTEAEAPLVPLLLKPLAVAVERITVPLGGGLVASTRAENDTVMLCPGARLTVP